MSLTKAKAKAVRGLAQKKQRERESTFVVEGIRLVQEAVHSDYRILEAFYTADLADHPGGAALLHALKQKARDLARVSPKEIERLSGTVTCQGVVAVLGQKRSGVEPLLQARSGPSTLVAVEGVADPGNLGSMVRTCDWFGVTGILIGDNSVEVYNPKVVRATMGSVFHVPIADGVDLRSAIGTAKERGYRIYATDLQGETDCDRVRPVDKSLIVFGNEARGVSDQIRQLADVRVTIRRYGSAESLNVGVACGIVLAALRRPPGA